MTSQIIEYDAPRRFVDQQVTGPFRRWWHEHRFEEHSAGTRMIDVVEYVSPAGPVGRLVDRMVLTGYLTGLLKQRNEWLSTALGGGRI